VAHILKRRGIPFRGDTPPRDDRPAASHDQIISRATCPVHTHVAPTRALATPARPHR
jgi:hypothetical protein